jgi:hypothetical protein
MGAVSTSEVRIQQVLALLTVSRLSGPVNWHVTTWPSWSKECQVFRYCSWIVVLKCHLGFKGAMSGGVHDG